MRAFSDFLTVVNNLWVPVGNLGIPRAHMPQIDDADAFLKCAESRGINIKAKPTKMKLMDLKLTQNEINKMKILRIMRKMRKGTDLDPIFVSSDNFVLDGSHRFVAAFNKDKFGSIKVYKIPMRAVDAVRYIREKMMGNCGTSTRSLSQ